VMIGVIGLFMSALLGRTGRATAATYVVVLLLTFGQYSWPPGPACCAKSNLHAVLVSQSDQCGSFSHDPFGKPRKHVWVILNRKLLLDLGNE